MSKFAQALLVATSISPILITVAISEFLQTKNIRDSLPYAIGALTLVLICILLLVGLKRGASPVSIKIKSVAPADKEVIAFWLAYLLPLIRESRINLTTMAVVLCIIFLSLLTTNTYHFNPVLGMLGYHFYEITTIDEIKYVLLTRKSLTNTKAVSEVVEISHYMLLDVSR